MRHCEERSDEAIQSGGAALQAALDCFACARNDVKDGFAEIF